MFFFVCFFLHKIDAKIKSGPPKLGGGEGGAVEECVLSGTQFLRIDFGGQFE